MQTPHPPPPPSSVVTKRATNNQIINCHLSISIKYDGAWAVCFFPFNFIHSICSFFLDISLGKRFSDPKNRVDSRWSSNCSHPWSSGVSQMGHYFGRFNAKRFGCVYVHGVQFAWMRKSYYTAPCSR